MRGYKDGVLLHRGTDKGGKLQVNDLLAIVGAKGEDVAALVKQNGGGGAPQPAAPAPAAAPEAAKEAPKEAPSPAQPAAAQPAIDISKMEEVILMPRLSDTMTEGVIASWHKKVGDMVKKGDVLADIETDKATMELESYKEGKLLYTGAKEGEKIAVNDLLAIIGGDKVDVQKIVAASKGGAPADTQKEVTTPAESNAEQLAVEPNRSTEAVATATGSGSHEQANANGRVKASPLAKKAGGGKRN